MTKEEKNQEQRQIIEVDIPKSIFKKMIQAHKKFALQGKNVEHSCLSWINFKISEDKLILQTTNGNKALQSKLELMSNHATADQDYAMSGEFKLSMALVSKLSFVKSINKLDTIRIKKEGNCVEFFDIEFNTTQKLMIKSENEKYPKIEDLIPSKNSFTASFALDSIKDITKLSASYGYVDFSFDPKNNKALILVGAEGEQLTQQAIFAPVTKN